MNNSKNKWLFHISFKRLFLINIPNYFIVCRYYAHPWRRWLNFFPLWEKGEKTEKQPVWVGDVAAGIVNAAKDPDTAGQIYQAVG